MAEGGTSYNHSITVARSKNLFGPYETHPQNPILTSFTQSLVARRWQSFKFTSQTGIEFNPVNFQQSAGLVCYYNTQNWIYLNLTYDEIKKQRYIEFISCENMKFSFLDKKDRIYINDDILQVHFKVDINYDEIKFSYSLDDLNWDFVGDVMDSNKLSDDYIRINNHESFTGAFVGMCCQDISGENIYADFDYFVYKENN